MFVLYINRHNQAHILNFRMQNNALRMLCGKTWPGSGRYITLAADDTFPGICTDCKRRMDTTHQVDIERDLPHAYNNAQSQYRSLRQHHQNGLLGPQDSYEYLEHKKPWPKLARLREQLTRKKNG